MTHASSAVVVVPTVAVVVASKDRPEALADLIDSLARQTTPGFTLVLSVPDSASLPTPLPADVVVVHSLGSSAQRNAGIRAVPAATHVFFFDDDAVVREDYLENAMRFFAAHTDVVGITGRVLLDGANATEVPLDQAEKALAGSTVASPAGAWRRCRDLYGCNFAYDRARSGADQFFDERLPLYGWLEDQDFARRLMRVGRLAHVEDCVIVHRGIRSGGRVNHRRFGYSQIANPAYLARKGSFPVWLALVQAVQPLAKNVVRSVRHQERPWRRDRLRGNALALGDLVRRRFTPERMLDL